jgi:pimeloyl-ACP methyl ester carboxylesterase
MWGGRDRYLPVRFAREYAAKLPGSELIELPEAGHWPWIDAPETLDRVIRFLE